ncbi:methyl-accepting chemotaxis protein [Oceanidesulfovibrio marinus]|uniref:HAMP domain-containing protein n=1 Tax=Oceanidesulfovibrio marinus TaxID=370038 RepID=A0ABX6NLB8_9BACT|nr:methyl-accepting chemotaxis protein [Oceanidesulfovibrio marinus]QJT11016.1 HAMP domain-containing protein [Oceanidesulfovibrio marinus]
MFKKMNLTVRMILGFLIVTVIAVGAVSLATFFATKTSIVEDGKQSAMTQLEMLSVSLNALYESTQDKVNSDLKLLTGEIEMLGLPALDNDEPITTTVVNQETGQSEQVTIPVLKLGYVAMNDDTSIVDRVKDLAGGGAVTIFEVLPDKLLRVSTNVLKTNGERATGTYIPSDSPVYKTVMQDKTFHGKAYVVNAWYSTAYYPLKGVRGNIVAVLFVGRKIINEQAKLVLSKANLYGRGYSFLFNGEGQLVYHPNDELRGKTLDDLGLDKELFVNAKNEIVEYDFKGDHKFAAVGMVDEDLGWRVGLALSESEMLHGLDKKLLQNSSIAAGAALVLIILFALFFTRSLVSPIKALRGYAEEVASGNLDARSGIVRGDEIGALTKSIRHMVDTLKGSLQQADEAQQQAKEQARLADVKAEEADQAKQEAEKAKVHGMREAAGRIESIVSSVTSATEELSAQVDESSHGANIQRERAGETATAMEEMNATVLEVARNASEAAKNAEDTKDKAKLGADIVQSAVNAIHEVQKRTDELKNNLGQLGEHAEGIGRVMTVITDIADQTNLLALNAAIEAARAGDAGRGFAVVADEVRKLAEKTMAATKEVGEAINSIQTGAQRSIAEMDEASQAVSRSTKLAGESGESLSEILSMSEGTSEQVRSIATAAEQQSSAVEQVGRSTEEINRISIETAETMNQAAQALNEVARLSSELNAIVQEMKA